MKKILAFAPTLAILAAGCSSGDTPTETHPVAKTPPSKESLPGAVQNSNLPPAARDALLNKKK